MIIKTTEDIVYEALFKDKLLRNEAKKEWVSKKDHDVVVNELLKVINIEKRVKKIISGLEKTNKKIEKIL